MISRLFAEGVAVGYFDGEVTKKALIFKVPYGRANFAHILCCLSLTIRKHRCAPRAANMTKIGSAK